MAQVALVSSTLGLSVIVALLLWRHVRRRQTTTSVASRLTWPELGVAVAQSTIAGAGNGLFATRDFAAGETLATYYGEVLSFAKMALRENRDYIMGGFGLNCFIDAAQQLDCPARYINDCFEPSKINARFLKVASERRAYVIATRPLAAGEEVFASYGEEYWKPRGIDPTTGAPAEPDEETKEGLRLLEAARARGRRMALGDGHAKGNREA